MYFISVMSEYKSLQHVWGNTRKTAHDKKYECMLKTLVGSQNSIVNTPNWT